MALQIRRGLEADLPASPADGELLYATDTNKLYVGDNGTAQEISGGGGSGGLANVVDDTTPQLGGDLDVNGRKIISTNNGNIEIDPAGTGNIILHGNLTIDTNGNFSKAGSLNITPTTFTSFGNNTTLADGNVYITRNSYSNITGSGFTFAQHHDTADAVNFTFFRTRGTGTVPTAVVNGDDVADLAFAAFNGTATVATGAISAIVDGVPAGGQVPMKFQFLTNNGTTIAARAELSATGVWRVNNLQNFSGTSLTLTATTVNVAGNMQLNAQNDLRFADSDNSNWIAFQAPATISSNVTWTLPAADGLNGQVLTTDGVGVLTWSTPSGGVGLPVRTSLPPVTTSTLTPNSSETVLITGYKGYILYKIETSAAAWVRIYSSIEAKNADATRLEGTDPLPGSGVIAEIITTGNETILITPGAIGFSTESPPSVFIPCTITNKSGITTTITVTVTALQIEA